MLFGTIAARLLGSPLTCKGTNKAGEDRIRAGESTIRAGQNFLSCFIL